MRKRSLLEDILSTPDEDIETFMEAISPIINSNENVSQKAVDVLSSFENKVESVKGPDYMTQQIENVVIIRGWINSDYVWHFKTARDKKPFSSGDYRVCYAVSKVLNEYLPTKCEVKIWLPYSTWNIFEYTYRAYGLADFWQINDRVLELISMKMFEVLNPLV